MERLQAISWIAFSLFIAALVFGIRDIGVPVLEIELRLYAHITFIFVLRFKMALDDHFYFGVTLMKRWQSVLGFAFGIISWFFYIFAAYSLSDISESYILLLIAIGVSTLWIVTTSINEGFYSEQVIWIATNAIYMIGLGFLLWEENTPSYPQLAWVDATVKSELTPIVAITVLLLTVIIDFVRSKSMEHAR